MHIPLYAGGFTFVRSGRYDTLAYYENSSLDIQIRYADEPEIVFSSFVEAVQSYESGICTAV